MKEKLKAQNNKLMLCIFFAIISSTCSTAAQFAKGKVLDFALDGATQKTVYFLIILLTLIGIEIASGHIFHRYRSRYSVGNTHLLRAELFSSILRKPPVEQIKQKQGAWIAKYTNQIDLVSANYYGTRPLLAQVVIQIIFVTTALFLLNWKIAIVTIALLSTPLYIPTFIEKKLQKAQGMQVSTFQHHLGKVTEWLSAFELIKNFSIENTIQHLFFESNDIVKDKALHMRYMTNTARSISAILSYGGHFAILAFSVWLILKAEFSAGNFIIALGLMDQLSYPIISISGYLNEIKAAKPSAIELLDIMTAVPVETGKTVLKGKVDSIVFDSVHFSYHEEKPLVDDFSLEIQRNEKCLIMGPSGSGKSTTMNILLNYYTPDRGSVQINGCNVNEIANLHDIITVMRQESAVFSDTVRNNLTMYQAMPDERLMSILESLGLVKFASTEGLDYLITENGANLSGGELKRICLARTLLRDTEVVILDEPLSNIDLETVEKIEDFLLSINDKIVFVITHEFSLEKRKQFDIQIQYESCRKC